MDEDENSQFLPTLPAGQLGNFFYDEYKEPLSYSCSSLSSCASLHPRSRTLGESDTNYVSMIDTSLEFEYYSDEQNWTNRYILYKLLKQGNFEAEENRLFEYFLADNANTEYGLLYNAEFLVRNSIGLKQTQWDTLIEGIVDIGLYQAQLDTLIPNWEAADSSLLDSLVEQMFVAYGEPFFLPPFLHSYIPTILQSYNPKSNSISPLQYFSDWKAWELFAARRFFACASSIQKMCLWVQC